MPEGFQLVPLRSGVFGVRAEAYGEVWHPGLGPAREAEALYVDGVGWRARLAAAAASDAPELVVWDVGLGGAANAVTVIGAARDFAVRLRVVSLDRSLAGLDFATAHAEELGYFGDRLAPARRLLGEPVVAFRCGAAEVVWERVVADIPAWLRSAGMATAPKPHLVLFDPHSPAANPEMWTRQLFADLFAALDPARMSVLATYSRSTAVRVALLLAGFHVGTGARTGTKEETTVAANRREAVPELLGERWLARVQRSGAAEPWTGPPFRGQPLTPATWEALRRHPQFATARGAAPSPSA